MPIPRIKLTRRSRFKLAILVVKGGILQNQAELRRKSRSMNTKTSRKHAAIRSTNCDDALLKSGSAVRSTVKLANMKPVISATALMTLDKCAR